MIWLEGQSRHIPRVSYIMLEYTGEIQYNTGGSPAPFRVSVSDKFCIQLALSISPKIMDRF